ncbi:hypothetical protein B0H10DRAFT_1938400 [Mycena sp. CBHHK59/15]|nr:hypothetical protein B0H10DRAFT_1938400 [Mycena sp. CBHHK59/15]
MPIARVYVHRLVHLKDLRLTFQDILDYHGYRIRTLSLTAEQTPIGTAFLRLAFVGKANTFAVVGILRCSHFQQSRRNDFVWSQWNAQNITSLTRSGMLKPMYQISMSDMLNILTVCQSTLRQFDFQGAIPDVSEGEEYSEITLPILKSMRLGYLGEIWYLPALISAPGLETLVLHDTLASPTTTQTLYDTDDDSKDNLEYLLGTLIRNCKHLRSFTPVAMDECLRDVVDLFFSELSELVHLSLLDADSNFSDALFQPEAQYTVPRIISPKLESFSVSYVPPTDLARFLLRHKTVDIAL